MLAIGLLGLFALAGILRGALASCLALLCLVGAYAVAFVGASREAPGFARAVGVPDFLGAPLLGAALFFGSFVVARIVSGMLIRRARRRRRHPRTALDRLLGGCFGAARGGVFVLLVCMLALWLDALRVTGAAKFLPAVGDSRAAAVTAVVVESGLLAATAEGGPAARFLARTAARPASSLSGLEALIGDARISALQQDSLFWTYVENGAIDAALNRASFLAVQGADDLRRRFAELGFVDAAAGAEPGAFRSAMRTALEKVGPRLRGLRDDPRVRALIDDPEVAARLRGGETFGLLSDTRVRDLVADVATRPR